MDTVSPGLEGSFTAPAPLAESWPRLSRRWWGAIALVVLFGAAAAWRFAICFSSVLACTR